MTRLFDMNKAGSKTVRRLMLNHVDVHQAKGDHVWLSTGFIAASFTLYLIVYFQSTIKVLEADLYSLQVPASIDKPTPLPARERTKKQEEIKLAQGAMAELALPWEPLFQMLESTKLPQVRLMAIEPNAKQHRLRLTAEAVNFSSMLEYANLLSRQPILIDSFLLNHEQAADGRAMPFSFVIEAVWLN